MAVKPKNTSSARSEQQESKGMKKQSSYKRREKNMPRIEREIVINRPVEEVLDFLADGRNEPNYNPHMLRAEQTSVGPIGRGTQFRTEVATRGRSMEMAYEIAAYERPQRLAARTIKAAIDSFIRNLL
ncbi:MAG TPA: hypothetical protein DCL75_12525 [Ktedonobacter sp.]|jgi:Polyketide cyclase / dehydrase and lipid transport|nr:hypothetical protein [Ktedonobacter sp.]HCJ33654.1 hypothetical protein [Ktedonobacter sp.]